VKIVTGDTATCPWDVGTHASRGAFTACNASIMVAEKAQKKIFELTSEHFMLRVKSRMKKKKRKDPDFETPLGIIKSDGEAVDRLKRSGQGIVALNDFIHRSEHSVEFQLIFLQHVMKTKDFTIIPILYGSL